MTSSHDPYSPEPTRVPDPLVVDADGTVVDSTGEEMVVPKGSSAEVMEWVSGDEEKARMALEEEESTNKPRKGLVNDLKELLGE